MQRIVVARSATLERTFTFVPTTTPTVAVTRSDGTAVPTTAVAATADPATFNYTILASSLPQLDELTTVWTAMTAGEAQTFTSKIEVAGGTLFTIAEAQAMPGLASKTATEIGETRTLVEDLLEHECGVAFVPRYYREKVSGDNGTVARMKWTRIRAIRSVSQDGTVLGSLAGIVGSKTGLIYNPSRWARGFENYDVAYEHGHSTMPTPATRAALDLCYDLFTNAPGAGGIDPRTETIITPDGTLRFGQGSFGIRSVDQFVADYSERALVA